MAADLDRIVAELRSVQGRLQEDLRRVDRALEGLTGQAAAEEPPAVRAATGERGPSPPVAAPPAGTVEPKRPTERPALTDDAKAAAIRRQLEKMLPGTHVYEVHQVVQSDPDRVWSAETVNQVLAANNFGQGTNDPVNNVRTSLSKLDRGGWVERVDRGRFRLASVVRPTEAELPFDAHRLPRDDVSQVPSGDQRAAAVTSGPAMST